MRHPWWDRRVPAASETIVELVRLVVREELEALGIDTGGPPVHLPEQPPEPPVKPREEKP